MPGKKKKDTDEKKEEPKAGEVLETTPPTEEDTNRLHRKKTKEEMQEENEKLLEGIESDTEDEEETPPDEEEETPEEDDEEETPPTEKELENVRKRYEDSSREAFILHNKNKKMTEAIEKASDIPEPTEEELKEVHSDWDEMSDFERRMAKDNLHNKRKLDAISSVAVEFKDMDKWNKNIDKFLGSPETLADHPEIDGREDEFKIFASKESRRGVDFETLVSAFLYEADTSKKPKKKGKMFETGSGGENTKPRPNDGKISNEDAVRLRQTNYKEYTRLLRAGKIDITNI